MNRPMEAKLLRSLLWFLAGAASVVTLMRAWRGLGAVSALDDVTPWGLWIAFDVVGGVALAAGGFFLAATVYVFRLERYRPVARAAVLTAFLGYGAVAVGLLYDVGRPERLWHAIIYWQTDSVMFEVAWCVMLYLCVLTLECATFVVERLRWERPARLLHRLELPIVVAGVMLSTLHQSSLGALFLIMPGQLDPLWHSALLPFFFLLSAIGLGALMVVAEGLLSARYFGREPEMNVLGGLARAGAVVLLGYLGLKLGQLAWSGRLNLLGRFEKWETWLCLAELVLVGLPALLLLARGVRRSPRALGLCAALVILGVTLNRFDVAWFGQIRARGATYVPSWMEFAVSLGLVAGMVLVFAAIVRHFPVFWAEAAPGRQTRLSVASV